MIKNLPEKALSDNDVIDIKGIINKLLFHWPLYVLMFLLSIAGAALYLRYSKPVYSSTAKIYIKDEKRGGAQSVLEDMGVFNAGKVVENEMEVIKSPLILADVIKKNRFNIYYFLRGKVANLELYEKSPIEIKILSDSANVGNYDLDVDLLKDNRFKIAYGSKKKKAHTFYAKAGQPFTIKKDKFALYYYPQLNTNEDEDFEVVIDSIQPLAYRKSEELQTTLVNRLGSVFEMTYEDEMPLRCANFLNAVADAYNQYTLDDKNKITLNIIRFIEGRLDSLRSELKGLETDVEAFKKTRGITEINESSKIILEQAKEADQRLNEANIQLSVYNEIDNYINSPDKGTPFTPIGNVDPALTSLITQYEAAVRERARLSLSLQPGTPQLIEVEDQIKNTRQTIKNYIAGYRRNAVTQRTGLQRKVDEVEGRINQIPTYERQYINIKREQSVKDALYNFLLQRKEESAVAYASNIVDNKIISPAFIPIRPIKPNRIIIYLFFLAAGFIVTTIYIRLKYLLNNTITGKGDIEKVTEIPIIAEVYQYDEKSKRVDLRERTVLAEQILNLRNNLKFLLAGVEHTPAIMFTSSISGEGKSFISSHLGNALTYNNKRAILLELDLRKPKLALSLGINNGKGLTHYLVGTESLDSIIKKVPDTDNLFIIPSGAIPPNPVELIESEKMKQLIDILREQYDYIIIDTSPVGMVSDAKSLSPYIDCSLFVVRFNYTPCQKFKEVASEIDKSIFKKAGVVFNGVDLESSYGSYGYGNKNYGYGYGTPKSKGGIISMFFRRLRHRMF